MIDTSLPVSELGIKALLEALLFVAPGPLTPAQMATAIDQPLAVVERTLKELESDYARLANERGLRIQRHLGKIQLTSAPQAAEAVERLLGLEISSRLSRAALETLAIVVYRQPTTRPQVDAIRGVNSDGVMKSLLSKGLIQEIGRADGPGRPILYGSTAEFLQYFGLTSLSELPPLDLEGISPESEARA